MGKKRVSRLLLIILNIVYFLAAVTILTIGSMCLAGDPLIMDLLDLIESTTLIQHILEVQLLTFAPSIYLVTLGSIAVILAFIGCFGALGARGWVLILFGVCKFCIILFNLALIMYNSIVPFHGKEHVQSLLLDNLKVNYQPTKIGSTGAVTLPIENSSANYWATMEFSEACCAAGDYTDYVEVLAVWEGQLLNNTEPTNTNISASCCMQIQQYNIPTNRLNFTNLETCLASPPQHTNSRGCIDYVMSIILSYRQVYILTAAAFIALEVLTIGLTVRVYGGRDSGVGII